ncbi:Uncharacterised protein [Mycobacteroides abscessus subsp. abscessus]|nr:Uncharacterised protein [Mycobacteroides abscessus subsp. abscessus]
MSAQLDQVVLGIALIGDKEHVDLIERRDGLHRQILGVAGADPDDANPSHRDLRSGRIGSRHRRGDLFGNRRDLEQIPDEVAQLLIGLGLDDTRGHQK